MRLEDIKAELQEQEEFIELQKQGVTFEDFTIIKGGKYIQKAKSGFSLYVIVVNDDNSLVYDFNKCDLEENIK